MKFSEFTKQEKILVVKHMLVSLFVTIFTVALFLIFIIHMMGIVIPVIVNDESINYFAILVHVASITIIVCCVNFGSFVAEKLGFYTPYDLLRAQKRLDKIKKSLENKK